MEPIKYHHGQTQTKDWEKACVKTRRSLAKRNGRIVVFDIRKSDKVLDLGCGDGLNIKIFRSLGIRNVVGIDVSSDLISQARHSNPKAKLYVGSAEKLPFKNEEFDVVFVDSVFHHIIFYDRVIKEIKRVLKKNGLLCFIEPHRSIFRSFIDFICILPISKFVPILKDRREAFLGEIHLMTHWLATEEEFIDSLKNNEFSEIFQKKKLLSILGEFQRN
ncbi:MAG: class I SAM-dependent methyltransferase [Candidatus Levybacteria bacterium]|nr:class I SAM-dependent methyltransferase [Candidatus Levybacteria bacterium]